MKQRLKKKNQSSKRVAMPKVKHKEQVYTAVYEKRDNWFIGTVEEIPGVNTQGKTLAETKKNLKEALELVLETNRILSRSESKSNKTIREPLAVHL